MSKYNVIIGHVGKGDSDKSAKVTQYIKTVGGGTIIIGSVEGTVHIGDTYVNDKKQENK